MRSQVFDVDLLESVRSSILNNTRFRPLQPWLRHIAFEPTDSDTLAARFTNPEIRALFPEHLVELLGEAVTSSTGLACSVLSDNSAHGDSAAWLPPPPRDSALRFDSFCAHAGNRLALAAARSISSEPGTKYNPLFLHGGVSTGKTHLLHAVFHALSEERPALRAAYLTGDDFTNILRLASRDSDSLPLLASLTALDALLLDDLHRIASSQDTQRFFLQVFDSLHRAGKQIVIASQSAPQAIPALSESLSNRLQWGLVIDLALPPAAGREELVRRKCEQYELSLPEGAHEYLSEHAFDNVRELEGILRKIQSHAALLDEPVDLPLIRKIVSDSLRQPERTVTLETIEAFLCDYFSVDARNLKSKSRVRSIAFPRQVGMYLAHTGTNASLEEIGRFFGGRDHSTVKHGCDKIRGLLENDPTARGAVHAFRRSLCERV